MSTEKKSKIEAGREQEIFDIIELSIDDLQTLARAFRLIEEACSDVEEPEIEVDSPSADIVWH